MTPIKAAGRNIPFYHFITQDDLREIKISDSILEYEEKHAARKKWKKKSRPVTDITKAAKQKNII